jgi:hypothetical protein
MVRVFERPTAADATPGEIRGRAEKQNQYRSAVAAMRAVVLLW